MIAAAAASSARAALDRATARLAAAGVDTPRVDAEWLLAGLQGLGRAALAARLDTAVPPAIGAAYEAAVRRRARREPLQHILGWEEFCGLRLVVGPGALIPRPETETLVEKALAFLGPAAAGRRLVIDVGTGTGAVACALAAARSDVRVVAVDVSKDAVALARRNVIALGLDDRVSVLAGDLLSGLGACAADLIVSNPPYLPTATLPDLAPEIAAHEPRLALDGGPDGLRVLRRLVADAPDRLTPGGALVVETAGGPHAHAVAGLMRATGFADVIVHPDLAGVDRFVTGVKQGPLLGEGSEGTIGAPCESR